MFLAESNTNATRHATPNSAEVMVTVGVSSGT